MKALGLSVHAYESPLNRTVTNKKKGKSVGTGPNRIEPISNRTNRLVRRNSGRFGTGSDWFLIFFFIFINMEELFF